MSDRHARILMMMARRSQRRLDKDDPADTGPAASREELVDDAQRTRRRLTAARLRKQKGKEL